MAKSEQSGDWPESLVRQVGAEMKRVRGRKSARWLSDETERLGHRVSPTVIAKLDGGHRGSVLNLHELIVIAAALEISPVELIYPPRVPEVETLPGKIDANYVAAEWFTSSAFYDLVAELADEIRRFQGQVSRVLSHQQGEGESRPGASDDMSPAQLAVLAARAARRTGQRIEALYDKVERAVWPGVMPYDGFRMAMDIVDDDDLTFPIEGGSDA